jgi:hypothetical protein
MCGASTRMQGRRARATRALTDGGVLCKTRGPAPPSGRRDLGDSSPANQLNRRRTTMKKPTASPVDAAASRALA